ncbi:MAG: hypothetical protein M5U28_13005 [Sandaracinaceae bacterium]|nr:hypothetical protein [Sandaracinaceae bacterium]
MDAVAHTPSARRWELYRLLSEPVRLRMLALASAEELAINELAELLGEGSPASRGTPRPCARRGCSRSASTAASPSCA